MGAGPAASRMGAGPAASRMGARSGGLPHGGPVRRPPAWGPGPAASRMGARSGGLPHGGPVRRPPALSAVPGVIAPGTADKAVSGRRRDRSVGAEQLGRVVAEDLALLLAGQPGQQPGELGRLG